VAGTLFNRAGARITKKGGGEEGEWLNPKKGGKRLYQKEKIT
jgi:hypothetical protein